jgi:hypothetical protein
LIVTLSLIAIVAGLFLFCALSLGIFGLNDAFGLNIDSRRWLLGIAGAYLLFSCIIITVLIIQNRADERGRTALIVLNIILMTAFPFGSVLGFYYFYFVRPEERLRRVS